MSSPHRFHAPTSPTAKPKMVTLIRIWSFLWPKSLPSYKVRLIIAIIAMIISKAFLVMVPATFKGLIDALSKPQAMSSIVIVCLVGYGGLRVLSSFFAEIRDTQAARISQRALRELGLCVFDHLHKLSLRFHLSRQTGGLARIIERGTKSIETLMLFATFNILPTMVEMILVTIALFWFYDYRYAIITLLTLLAYISYTIKLTEWRIVYVRKTNAMETQAQAKAIDSLLNFETVKYFGNEGHEHERFDSSLKIYEQAAIASRFSLAYLNFGQALILSVGLSVMMLIGTLDVLNNNMTIGDLVAINAFLIQLTIPLFNLGFAYREIKLALVNIEDMFLLLNEPYEITEKENPTLVNEIKKGIEFKNVRFGYSHEREILKDVSFQIECGKTVAVVGESGAGKSTLSRLLFRFYDVNEGAITFDGVDIRSMSLAQLRSIIGIVPQDTVLFNDTIFYNIHYGNPHASYEDVVTAAKKAEIYDFIQSLPDGFETQVGERGLKLSGGEKQRVAIARTLLKKPQLFIFDEATSALDTKTEHAFQENLERISKNVSTLIIAHRLSTIVHADLIVVMDKGRIIETGTHESLLEQQGVYFSMWERQLSGYENEAA